MLTLLTYAEAFGEPSGSPFCVKAMALMNLANADWVRKDIENPSKFPTGKLPILDDGGRLIPDSDGIRRHLETAHGVTFDGELSPASQALSHALQRMLEEHFYFVLLKDRWEGPAWPHIRAVYFNGVPGVLRPIVSGMVRKSVMRNVAGQGIGRMEPAAALERAGRDLDAVEKVLGDGAFLLGDAPSAVDCTVGPMLRAALGTPVDTPLKALVAERADLVAYAARVADRLYPKANA